MRTFFSLAVAIAGCAFGSAQSFNFHSLAVSGQSRFSDGKIGLAESVQSVSTRDALPKGFTDASIAASASVAAPAVASAPLESPAPPVGLMVGAAGVLLACGGGFRHLFRRQAEARAA